MPLWKHKAYNLTESEIRYAMRNSRSNQEAARFLRISVAVYKRYAQMYIDSETGKSLYEMHKNKAGVGISKSGTKYSGRTCLKEILNGEHPEYLAKNLKLRLIKEGYKAECCEMCGFEERRVTDYTVPLILAWVDGDRTNHRLENLQLICYNCFYLTQSSLFNRRGDVGDLNTDGY